MKKEPAPPTRVVICTPSFLLEEAEMHRLPDNATNGDLEELVLEQRYQLEQLNSNIRLLKKWETNNCDN